MMFELVDTIDVKNYLGEGVTWDSETQTVWWTDIEEKQLFSYQLDQRKLTTFDTPYRVCGFALTQQTDVMLAAFDCGIALYHLVSGNTEWLFQFPEGATVRFNEGRTDAKGRFWVGTMNENGDKTGSSGLYRVDTDLSVTKMEADVGICNGLAWNADASRFYMADSSKQIIYKYDFDIDGGDISAKSTFVQLPAHTSPDGAMMDGEGYLWSALWGGSCVARFSPTGEQQNFAVPVEQPTCVAFGGEHNDLLFVTSACYQLSDEALTAAPKTGSLFIYRTNVSSTPRPRFSGDFNHG
ncbi:SMP-30/gluconolactonase/LRE family protein [Shewanella avicenniae]|uniref:SMP-30/gluconolactonase/LRE family protein n=1 Tax=Shewanella avicenniae TaxID=2814294 RepID=A0ABX7QMI4_9GAMM|nr:SMP-30/gluconolactonase/LRE family protein [Shewanella avicenniae]QSX32652.1 SMP-30/gluconolactonase/LRE family protein [Shewanella avicenniae]